MDKKVTRRSFLRAGVVTGTTTVAMPHFIAFRAFGANDRIVPGALGWGGGFPRRRGPFS
jgi:hypothetical protein